MIEEGESCHWDMLDPGASASESTYRSLRNETAMITMMGTTTTGGQSDLSDLVDYPRETLDIELKEWIDLKDRVAQAKLAKHIAALANHGGGYLVFGLEYDTGLASPSPPASDPLMIHVGNLSKFAKLHRF